MPSNSPTVPTVPQMPIPSITPANFSDENADSRTITNDEGGGRNNPQPATTRDIASSSSSPYSSFQDNISSIDMTTFHNRPVSSGMAYQRVKSDLPLLLRPLH